MARPCSICGHAARAEIDRCLVSGTALRDISGQFRVSRSALSRHQADHIPMALVVAREAQEVAQADDLLGQVRALGDETHAILSAAKSAGDNKLALAAIDRALKCLELLGRLAGELGDGGGTVNVLVSPDWVRVRALILAALAPHPDARAAVAAALLAHGGTP